jgi:hypothetical protein
MSSVRIFASRTNPYNLSRANFDEGHGVALGTGFDMMPADGDEGVYSKIRRLAWALLMSAHPSTAAKKADIAGGRRKAS